jgi:hypothetical protein
MRALLRPLAVISIAISPLSAQAPLSTQDALAYTTTSVRLHEKPAGASARCRDGTFTSARGDEGRVRIMGKWQSGCDTSKAPLRAAKTP